MPPAINIHFDSLENENPKANIHVSDDETNYIHQGKQTK
jgi:hypothetical protein